MAARASKSASKPAAKPAAEGAAKAAAKPVTVKSAEKPAKPAKAEPIIALDLPAAPLDAEIEAYFQKCRDKIGYVPNVLLAYTHDLAKLKAFSAM